MDMLPDEELRLRAELQQAVEREDIVARYDQGRAGPIDPWEDPKFEVYHATDRHGFIHDTRLPSDRGEREKELIKIELGRVRKWLKMISSWDKYRDGQADSAKKLNGRIYKGLPAAVRGNVWCRLLGVEEVAASQRGVYERMRERGRLSSPDIRQIDLDVNRTYRNHIDYRERYGIKQQALFHVLAAYSMYNSEVGYCQGMSQIAALLLMFMTEEQAFWGLSQLFTSKLHCMHGFFAPGFPKLLRFQDHLETVLKKYMPKMSKFMDANNIAPSVYALKWFMQCFVDRTPFPLTLRLWDVFLLDGDRVLVPMAFTVFRLHQKHLLKLSMENFVMYLQQDLEKDFGYDDDAVLSELKVSIEELRRAGMDVPPPPSLGGISEVPTLPFGLTFYPSRADILKKLNDIKDNPGNLNGVKDQTGNVTTTSAL